MAGDPLIKESDGKPILNKFGLPVICNDVPDNNEGACCEPCSDFMFCLQQAFYTVDMNGGIDLENWLADHWLSTNVQYKDEQSALTFDNGGTVIFDGEFLAEPPSQDATAQYCPFPEREDECDHTHRMRHEHTLLTNSPEGLQVKRFGLNVNTECVTVGEDKFLRFTLNMVWENGTGNAVYEPAIESELYCPPKGETLYDPSSSGKEWCCCPLAVSDLIDVSTLTSLADLSSVTLHPLPACTSTYDAFYGCYAPDSDPSQRCLQTTGTWVCCTSILHILCEGGAAFCAYYAVNECTYTIDGDVPPLLPEPEDPEWQGEALGCTSAEYAGGCGAPGTDVCQGSICISRPVEFIGESITLKVIDNKCQAATDCKACTTEGSPVATPIQHGDVRFDTATAFGACTKRLFIVHPDCVEIDKVYWSDGVITDGDDERDYHVTNDPDSLTGKVGELSALIATTNGCFYCWSQEFGCGCCDGATGSLSYSISDDDNCLVTLTAHTGGVFNCPNPFIEVVYLSPDGEDLCYGTDFPADCACEHAYPGSPSFEECEEVFACRQFLYDGDEMLITVRGCSRIRYRVWDAICGCASDWIEFPICCTPCENCTGTITLISVEVSNWNQGGEFCPACDSVNTIYWLRSDGDVNSCTWRFDYLNEGSEWAQFCCSEFDCYGVQIALIMSCIYESTPPDVSLNDAVLDVVITAGGSAAWSKTWTNAQCPDNFSCEDYTTAMTAADQTSHTDGSCVTEFASCLVTFYVAT